MGGEKISLSKSGGRSKGGDLYGNLLHPQMKKRRLQGKKKSCRFDGLSVSSTVGKQSFLKSQLLRQPSVIRIEKSAQNFYAVTLGKMRSSQRSGFGVSRWGVFRE